MPIYEYQAKDPFFSCPKCLEGFEIIQGINESLLTDCIYCGKPVRKLISKCHAAVIEQSEANSRTMNRIKEYEKSAMWSHAAELADKHSESIKDNGLKLRALDNYKKAGYDTESLAKHAKLEE